MNYRLNIPIDSRDILDKSDWESYIKKLIAKDYEGLCCVIVVLLLVYTFKRCLQFQHTYIHYLEFYH